MTERSGTPGVERVAAVVERLAVLMEAGVPPASAWGYLADQLASSARPRARPGRTDRGDPRVRDLVADTVTAAATAAREGREIAAAIVGQVSATPGARTTDAGAASAWRAVAAAWHVATQTGAPLATSLRRLADAQRALGQTQRDVAAALAGPRATSRLVAGLPLVGILFGLALGFDTVRTLFVTPPGLVCLALGTALMLLAWRWSSRMVRRATPVNASPGLVIELTAIAMASGSSLERAIAAVDAALVATGLAQSASQDAAAVDSVLSLSRAAGVPAGTLLRGEAEQARRDARSAVQLGSAALATRLMLPLGVCVLPSFMLLGVAPLMLSVLSSTLSVL